MIYNPNIFIEDVGVVVQPMENDMEDAYKVKSEVIEKNMGFSGALTISGEHTELHPVFGGHAMLCASIEDGKLSVSAEIHPYGEPPQVMWRASTIDGLILNIKASVGTKFLFDPEEFKKFFDLVVEMEKESKEINIKSLFDSLKARITE